MDWNSAIVSGFRAGIVAIRPDGAVGFINAIGSRILSGSPLAVGENIKDRAGENPFFWMLSEAISLDYLSPRVETCLTDRNGEPMRIGFTLSALKEGERKAGVCAYFKDLRHVEIAEEKEDIRQRLLLLERVGSGLAGALADPIENLGVVCNMLRAQVAQEKIALAALPMLEEEIARLERVIRECQGFIRPVAPSFGNVPVDTLVEEIVSRLAGAHTGTEFTVNRPAGTDFTVDADAALLAKALSIVVACAVDACANKGGIEIALSRAGYFFDVVKLDREARHVLPGHSGKEEEYVRIAIRHDGPGDSRERLDRVFIPFDPGGKPGAGTGLSVAQKIVAAHGGILESRQPPGKRVEFRIMVPVRQKRAGS